MVALRLLSVILKENKAEVRADEKPVGAEDYTKQVGWRDLAELKCCMCALGLLLGLAVPRRWRKKAVRGAAVLFAATCIPQAAKFPALAVRRTQGTEAKRERLAFCCKK